MKAIKQYSQAIYELASENKLMNKYIDLSLALINVSGSNEKVFVYLSSPDVNHDQKKELIEQIVGEYKYYKNWLNILVDAGKSRHILNCIEEFIHIYNKENNIVEGYAWTTEPLKQEVINTIEKKVTKKINKKVMIKNKIDKQLIGGIKLEIGDDVWDNTIKNKLVQLIKEGEE